jgi:hypothetical protein
VKWRAPLSTGSSPLTEYVVSVWRAGLTGRAVLDRTVLVTTDRRSVKLSLHEGRYRFAVAAVNAVGTGPRSARTAWISPR